MKIAVIGTGQLGSDIIEEFKKNENFKVIPLSHQDLDITIESNLKKLEEIKPDIIINTAGYTDVDKAEDDIENAFRVNSYGALYIAKLSNKINALNIYISTDFVFDGNKNSPYTEEDKPNPINIYGISKYLGEIFTQNYSKRYYIIRVASLYGKYGSKQKGGNFVDKIINKAKNNEEIKVVDDIVMSPTYTKDVANMLEKIIEIRPDYGVYHCVNEGYTSWYNLAKKILEYLNIDKEIIPIKSDDLNLRAKRPKFSALENSRLHSLGLRMPNWEDGLYRYLKEYFSKI
ncbi:MAG: dTDP-4-dehydrorhamnose reductase [Nanopusillaceae archaeon]